MKILKELLYKVSLHAVSGATDRAISLVTADSRSCCEGALFVAINGVSVNGHQFIDAAIEKGVSAIICEQLP